LFLFYAASVEYRSEHLLAKAITNYAQKHKVIISEVEEYLTLVGAGAEGEVNKHEVLLGTEKLMLAREVDLTTYYDKIDQFHEEGNTLIFIAIDNKLEGIIALSDIIKPQAGETIQQVKDLNIQPSILTGDNTAVANQVGEELGIEIIKAGLLPQQKLNEIKLKKESGEIVGMIGDGINDAPSLAEADISIALSSGSEIAIETASVTLTGGDITKVPTVIRLARAMLTNIKQNLFWAFIYNILAIPIAAGVFYPVFQIQLSPIIGAAAMSFSSIFVINNALRLRKFK